MEVFTIDKLLGSENWVRWKWMVEGLLMEKEGAFEVCSGEIVKPEPVPDGATADIRNKFDRDFAKFDKGNRAARGIFSRTLDSRICDLVSMCKTAREIWVKLNELFEQKNKQAQYACQLQFSSFIRDPTDTITMHIAKLERLVSRMHDLEIKPNDFVVMSKLLETLPKEFEPLKMAWCARPEEQQTLPELKGLLIAEEQRKVTESSRNSELVALLAKASVGKTSRSKQAVPTQNGPVEQRKKYKCFKCGKKGHMKKDCRFQKNNYRSANHDEKSNFGEVFISECLNVTNDNTWVIDTGATQHIANKIDLFQSYIKFECPIEVRVGNRATMKAYGHGVISLEMLVHGSWRKSFMENVLYAPDAARNLFSVSQALDHGCEFNMSNDKCEFSKSKGVVAVGIRCGNLFKLLCKIVYPEVKNNVVGKNPETHLSETNSLQVWHERLGHLNKHYVKKLLQSHNIEVKMDSDFCEACILGKQHRLPFQSRQQHAKEVGELIHSDLCGPMEQESIGGSRYYVCFTDDFSKYRKVYFLKHKSETVAKFEEFCTLFQKQTGKPIKAVLSDGGLEYVNKRFKNILQRMGAEFRCSTPYTPQQNGTAERTNRTLVDLARSIMIAKSLPKSLWAELINTVVYILNRAGTSSVDGKTPFELFCGRTPRLNHLRIIGTECFTHVPKQKQKKWNPRSERGVLVGYLDDVDGYRVWVRGTRKVKRTREVVFTPEVVSSSTTVSSSILEQPINVVPCSSDSKEEENDSETANEEIRSTRQLRNRENIKAPERLIECCFVEHLEPENYYQAVNSDDTAEWQAAMDEELKSLSENKTWYLTELPEGRRAISNKWVYKVKRHANGEVDRFKARLVVKGFSQKAGIDYYETFSPVARFETIRSVISVAANEGLDLMQFDVRTAFLYGSLKEEIYMFQPEGYDDESGRVCRLVKSLYGLKQSPRCWNTRFKEFLSRYGLKESKADPCLFYNVDKEQKLLLALFVDDGLVAVTSKFKVDFFEELQREFKVTYKDADYFLSLEIKRLSNGDIFIGQPNYATKVLKKFNMWDANPVSTPVEKCQLAGEEESDWINCEKIPYRQVVGSLMYMAVATRPDISFVVSFCSQFLDKADQRHWSMIKRVLKYIKGTINFGILFQRNFKPGILEAYSDADYANDPSTRKSVSGTVFKYSGGAISWTSRRQQCVSLSTTEAEYVAASEATKDIIWLKWLFQDIAPLKETPTLHVDNASAVRLTKNPEYHQRTKHIDIRYHFVRDKVLSGEILVEHIAGNQQVADIFTKSLPRKRFETLRTALGVTSINLN